MILLLILNTLYSVIAIILFWLPSADRLPFGIDSILVQGSGYLHFLAGLFPPIEAVLNGVLFILGYKLIMVIVRVIPLIGRMFRN